MTGPLKGVRLVELAGLGPAPFAGMMLADAGADIIRIDRSGRGPAKRTDRPHWDLLNRGRRSVVVDLKHPDGIELVRQLVTEADGLIEGYRPGVAERLGVGPDACLALNPALVYGRMTGWGQSGPMAAMAGHDVDYISIAGALSQFGRVGEIPAPPLNLVGDFGGGGMLLAFGMVSALLWARRTGQGQVIDAAMVDGAAAMLTMEFSHRVAGLSGRPRGENMLDTGAHFYEVYETSDGAHVAVGAIEPQFYAELVRLLGIDNADLPEQMDRTTWVGMKEWFANIFAKKTRDEWADIFMGSDACVAPVLSLDEAIVHPHNVSRQTFTDVGGVIQPAPAPRFSLTPGSIRRPPPHPGQGTDDVLTEWGLDSDEIQRLRTCGAVQ